MTGTERAPAPRFVLTLVPVGGIAAPPLIRLRRLLKALLRSYGLRCVRVEERPRDADPAAAKWLQ